MSIQGRNIGCCRLGVSSSEFLKRAGAGRVRAGREERNRSPALTKSLLRWAGCAMQRHGVYIGDNLQEMAGQTELAKKRLVTKVRSQNWHVQAFIRLSQLARSQSMVSCACLGRRRNRA